MFIDRKAELELLSQRYNSGQAELIVLYGRRRVGKTELLRAFCADKPHIFFIATLSNDIEQLATFSQQLYIFTHASVPVDFSFPSWEAAFQALAEIPMQPRPVIILDEFTYLINGNKAVPSILQKVWDETLKDTGILLVLCGSYIGMMESEVLGYQAPLYGRRTASTLLRPLDLPSAAQFFPNYSPEQQFLAWSILGGMPYYLGIFKDHQDIPANIRQNILDSQMGALFNEPRLLLMEELREPRNYFSILRAIALGNARLNEVAQASGVREVTAAARYLDILQQMRLVTRQVPATESQPDKSKKGLYRIDDHFLRFWFRYVQPNQAGLDLGLADAILQQRILPDLDHFAATAFEEAAQAYVARLAQNGKMAFLPERIGGWWDRETEIDVLAISRMEKAAWVGECKWSIRPVGTNVLDELKQKAQSLLKSGEIQKIQYAIFARSAFTPALESQARFECVGLYTVDMLLKG
ncbi:predicted ATPase [Longilinea arvoryzae]|uniref:Predicted ATPase n=1 Tax=Longilinea arvoryzae TaxID=360412 RepID=A0A0S7BI60_9CHLR|nr:ATP-binding protein [Longilinea arvoryzae]GAP13992.1 predicted ATPase [Longilinea arvoryzae]